MKTEPDAILNTELDDRVQATRVELLGKETIRFQDCPAVRFKLHDVPGGYFVEGILLLAKGRRYQLAVQFTSESSAAGSRAVLQFVPSDGRTMIHRF